MKFAPQAFAAAMCCLLAAAHADSVTLFNGQKFEGKVTRETPTEVSIQFQVSAGITDEKTFARDEIKSVQKETPESRDWAAIEALRVGPNSLRASAYNQVIGKLRAFASAYPRNANAGEVASRITAFEEEKARVDTGELKLNGKWLTAEDVEKRRYQLAALGYLGQMQELAARGDLVSAMNIFDQIEKEHPGARAYIDAVELARKVVPVIIADVARKQAQHEREQADLEKALERASPEEQGLITSGLRRQQAATDAALAAADSAGRRWKPLIAGCLKCLESLKALAPSEATRLGTINLEPMRESVKFVEEAKGLISTGDKEKAKDLLAQATALWAANEAATRWAGNIAESEATPNSAATPDPSPTPDTSPAPSATEPSVPETPASVTSAATPLPAATPASPAAADTPVRPAAKPFYLTIPGALGIVLTVAAMLGVVALLTRKKPRSYE